MKVTANQTIKQYKISSVQKLNNYNVVPSQNLPQQIKVVASIEKKSYIVTVAQLGVRGLAGMSAYDVAIKNGYVGSEEQWLISLRVDTDGGIIY